MFKNIKNQLDWRRSFTVVEEYWSKNFRINALLSEYKYPLPSDKLHITLPSFESPSTNV